MGRHSRGAGEAPAPLPDPPTRHPYAPRSADDSGAWDRSSYRVVDVGLPEGAPAAQRPGSRSGLGTGPSRFGPGESATRLDPEPPRYGSTRADLAAPSPPGSGFRTPSAGSDPRYAATRPEPRPGASAEPRFGSPAEPGFGGPVEQRPAAPAEPRFGGPVEQRPAAPAEPRFGPPGESRFGGPGQSRLGATRADLAESRFGAAAESRFGATRADLAPPGLVAPAESRFGVPGESRFGGGRGELAESRLGATRADLFRPPDDADEARYGVESEGSTALAPRPAPDPDEVTDTGARRARSAFRLATATATEEPDEDETETDYEPSLFLQWGIFVAQTLTGAVAGLGVWLGFYRLWSTWPFYAAPAVGVAAIAMLVLARVLRRRHSRDLDLLTAAVTVGISTVLTVLPAAFTLQNLGQ